MGFFQAKGTVSFEFLILFVTERAEPVNDDAFSAVVDELKNDDEETAEVVLTGFGI